MHRRNAYWWGWQTDAQFCIRQNHSFYNSTTPLTQLFTQIRSGFATVFPLWLSQPFRVTSAHTHTQAHTFLSQWSHIAFPLSSSVDAHIFYTCMTLQLTCHSLHMVQSDLFCGISKIRPCSSSATVCYCHHLVNSITSTLGQYLLRSALVLLDCPFCGSPTQYALLHYLGQLFH